MKLLQYISRQIERGKEKEREAQKARDAVHWALANVPQSLTAGYGLEPQKILYNSIQPVVRSNDSSIKSSELESS